MTNFQKFKIEDLFTSEYGDIDLKKSDINNKGLPVITSGINNYGILGLTNRKAKIIPRNTITVDMFGYAYYRDFNYKMVTHARVFALIPKKELLMSTCLGLYIQTCLNKLTPKYSYNNMCSFNKIKNEDLFLPINEDKKIDFNYIHESINELENERINELENERISELEYYLKVTGLNDYHLTSNDKEVLNKKVKTKEFKIAKSYISRSKKINVCEKGIFDIVPTKKKINANSVKFNGKYPYVARGESNNGIRGKIDYDESYLNPSNTISFGQDTATLYYQPDSYFTGDKIQILKLNNDYGKLTPEIALYLISTIKKALSTYSWGQQSFAVNEIANVKIKLPINDLGKINWQYMEQYIKAIEKITIENVVNYKDQVIMSTKEIVNNQ